MSRAMTFEVSEIVRLYQTHILGLALSLLIQRLCEKPILVVKWCQLSLDLLRQQLLHIPLLQLCKSEMLYKAFLIVRETQL